MLQLGLGLGFDWAIVTYEYTLIFPIQLLLYLEAVGLVLHR